MTVADFARFLAAQDGDRPLSRASVATLTSPSRLANGELAGEVFQWSRYGLGVGLDEILGEPATLHSGHSGVGFVRFPAPQALGGRVHEPRASGGERPGRSGDRRRRTPRAGARARGATSRTRPRSVARRPHARATMRTFFAGAPDLARYRAGLTIPVWEGAPGLAGRAPRLGELASFELLRDAPVDGERSLLFRARHATGTIYWRVSLDARGEQITRLVWWHL